MKNKILSCCLLTVLASGIVTAAGAQAPVFRPVEIDPKVEIGYGLAIADVNGDGKLDVLLADKRLIVWYENPQWQKHVMAENLTALDHVCIAAEDINGDGKAEVAVGAGWNPGDTLKSGAVFYLAPPSDRTARWRPTVVGDGQRGAGRSRDGRQGEPHSVAAGGGSQCGAGGGAKAGGRIEKSETGQGRNAERQRAGAPRFVDT
jgi:hypothetical protein